MARKQRNPTKQSTIIQNVKQSVNSLSEKLKLSRKKKKPNNDIGDQKHIKDQMIKFMAKEINKSSGTCFRGYAGNA